MAPYDALRIVEATLRSVQQNGHVSASNPAFKALDTLWEYVVLGKDDTKAKA